MLVHISELPLPVAPLVSVGAENSKTVKLLFEALVRVCAKPFLLAGRAEHSRFPDTLDAGPAEALPTAGDLIGLSEDQQTDGAVGTNKVGNLFRELTLKPRHG
jgi:hypothetical protein